MILSMQQMTRSSANLAVAKSILILTFWTQRGQGGLLPLAVMSPLATPSFSWVQTSAYSGPRSSQNCWVLLMRFQAPQDWFSTRNKCQVRLIVVKSSKGYVACLSMGICLYWLMEKNACGRDGDEGREGSCFLNWLRVSWLVLRFVLWWPSFSSHFYFIVWSRNSNLNL